MPQFDTTFFESQIFWTIISFTVLFVLLNHWVIPSIKSVLKKRADTIEQSLLDAEQAQSEAMALKSKYDEQLASIHQQSNKMMTETEDFIRNQREKALSALEQELQKKKHNFIKDEAMLHEQTLLEVRRESSQLILAAAEQLILHQYSTEDAQKELDDAISLLEDELNTIQPKDK
jgi:F-type H+-transporting ATPase subunit b